MKYKQKLQRITASKSWLFEKMSKTDKPLPQQLPPQKTCPKSTKSEMNRDTSSRDPRHLDYYKRIFLKTYSPLSWKA